MTAGTTVRALLLTTMVGCVSALPSVPPGEFGSEQTEEEAASVQESVGRVLSVTDSNLHYLRYIVEFQITQGPSSGRTLRCLIDGYGNQAEMLGKGGKWWWDFVYRDSDYKGHPFFEITYKPSEQRQNRRFDALELVSISPWRESR